MSNSPTSSSTAAPTALGSFSDTFYGFEGATAGTCSLGDWTASDSSAVSLVASVTDFRGDVITTRNAPSGEISNCMAMISGGLANVQNSISLSITSRSTTNFSFDYLFVPMDEMPFE